MKPQIIKRVEEVFLIPKIKQVELISAGNINSTYKLYSENGAKYILQKINKKVFTRPDEVMQNIRRISRYIEKKVLYEGGDPLKEVLHPIDTLDGSRFMIDNESEYWRIYYCIEGAKTYDTIDSKETFYQVGLAFGNFQKRLSDYPVDKLHEAIPDFHNTPKRFKDFQLAVLADKAGKIQAIKGQSNHPLRLAINYIMDIEKEINLLELEKLSGRLPIRVTHNDTKINNVMIDDRTGKAICVIDLDTVGPDTALVDFGDAIRSGANPIGEEPENIEDSYMDLGLFKAYTQGYLEQTLVITKDGKMNEDIKRGLTKNEVSLLHKSPRIMTLELAMRFIGDYLNGNEYFNLKEGQLEDINLKRGLVQLHLAEDMKLKENEMKKIIDEIVLNKVKNVIGE